MPPRSPQYIERDQALVEDRQAGMPLSQVAQKYGLQVPSVCAILRKHGVKGPSVANPGGSALENLRPITPLHRQIGMKLDAYRSFKTKQGATEAAFDLSISRKRLRKAELGAHDFTLTELQKIAVRLGVPLTELVKEAPPMKALDVSK